MNCQTFSAGLSSGHFGGSTMSVTLPGTARRAERCHPAWSRTSTACLPGATLGGDLSEVQIHRLGVAGGQDERSSLALAGADRAEDIGGSGALIVRRRGPCAASCPAPGNLVLLPDPSLVRKPDLYPVAIDPLVARDRVQALGKGFLKASIAPAAWA